MTIKQQHSEAMKIFKNEFGLVGINLNYEEEYWWYLPSNNEQGELIDYLGDNTKKVQSFLTSLYLITAENIVSDLKSEIARVEGMKKEIRNKEGDRIDEWSETGKAVYYYLSDHLLHLQSKLAVAEQDLEEIKL